ncbi:type II toxin-antitoxin system HicB family antitoxin [Candidatus Thiosymbion oneisti]|uniref:type II toxin-antitoxin system HicB family antitoxin n=1 Tax=Candidatus Thiosymbion oneisti TaxID=589554 RepID=UPI00105C44F9|nr:type II toxin-antitoxin system HicB family antitoxin [Candidatus Thiosymbion oneisti]
MGHNEPLSANHLKIYHYQCLSFRRPGCNDSQTALPQTTLSFLSMIDRFNQQMTMKIRYLVERDEDLYVAMSLEFGLAAQANTLAEAKTKLESQIAEYIEDLNEEKDDLKKQYLLNRKGPWQCFLLYYVVCLLNKRREGLEDR